MSGDYIMRQINDITRIIGSMIFMRKLDAFEILNEEGSVTQGETLRLNLRALVRDGKINEAENLLFQTVEAEKSEAYLPVALDFYQQLNGMTDEELAAASFSRAEIAEGLAEIKALFEDVVAGLAWSDSAQDGPE